MIAEKISGAEVVVASMESSIAEKERLIAEKERAIGDNRATLAGCRKEILNLQKQLVILDNINGVVPAGCAHPSSSALDARVREVVRVGDLATLTRKGVRQQLSLEFGTEFVWQNKLAIHRTIEEVVNSVHK